MPWEYEILWAVLDITKKYSQILVDCRLCNTNKNIQLSNSFVFQERAEKDRWSNGFAWALGVGIAGILVGGAAALFKTYR